MSKASALLSLVMFFSISSCKNEKSLPLNDLSLQQSAYLRLHADNPIDWHIWDEKTLEKAKTEDKLLIISIGYISCHWCHIMEKEVFSDDEVAAIMNDEFLSVKVDREERPDVDKVYVNASYLFKGSAGWPLNVIALPDGSPLYVDSYLAKDEWKTLLSRMVKLKKEQPQLLNKQASQLKEGLLSFEQAEAAPKSASTGLILSEAKKSLGPLLDRRFGGIKGDQKFPQPALHEYLLQAGTTDMALQGQVFFTLDQVLSSGVYDHLGNGFFRYATDSLWQVPHFEKMLYDNALLLSLYANAYKVRPAVSYKSAIEGTISFVTAALYSPLGLFYSSIDADSEGKEGLYYTWTEAELEAAGIADLAMVQDYFDIKGTPEIDHGHALYRALSVDELAEKYNKSPEGVKKTIALAKEKMLMQRQQRVPPFKDDKIITSWNAMMVIGLLDAYEALQAPDYLALALTCLEGLLSSSIRNDQLRHLPGGDEGYLEDYAWLIAALIKAYENTFEINHLLQAKQLTEKALADFGEEENPFLRFSKTSHSKNFGLYDIHDDIIPSSNAVMADNLFRLGHYLEPEWIDISLKMLEAKQTQMGQYPTTNHAWLRLASLVDQDLLEVAVVGENYQSVLREMQQSYLPNVLFLGTAEEENLELLEYKYVAGKTMIYVCKQKSCRLPVEDPNQALIQIEELTTAR